MSCLRFRILSPRKTWKSLTLGIFHKLRRSKVIKKPVITDHYNPTKWLGKHFGGKRKILKKPQGGSAARIFRSHLHKEHAPVYIDELFKEPVTEMQVGHLASQLGNDRVPRHESVKLLDQPVEIPITIIEERMENQPSPDDIWESARLDSTLMHGIDERAELFIAKFRAEMAFQEIYTRTL